MTPPLRILHRSLHEIVLVKPPGFPTEASRTPGTESVITRVRAMPGGAGAKLVHRLDAVTRGLLLVALTDEAVRYYNHEIAERRWRKWYVARVSGEAPLCLGEHRAHVKDAGRRARLVRAGGKPAILRIVAAAPAPGRAGERHVLVELLTGRFHQIRVMFQGMNAALVGDALYGGPPGPFYLDHVMLAVRLFHDEEGVRRFATSEGERERWAPELGDALRAEAERPAPPADAWA